MAADGTFDASAVLASLSRLGTSLPREASGALYEVAEAVMGESLELVPVDLGTLKNSHFVDRPVRSGSETSVTMGYGGEAAAYAEAVHEHPSSASPASWLRGAVHFQTPGTGPKFLERPVVAAERTFAEDVGTALKSRLGI